MNMYILYNYYIKLKYNEIYDLLYLYIFKKLIEKNFSKQMNLYIFNIYPFF